MIITNSGRIVNPFDLKPEDISMHDILISLSSQRRYAGQTGTDYSVAEHSVLCMLALLHKQKQDSNKIDYVELQTMLMHDATEAYFIDIPGPIKRHLDKDGEISKLEDGIWQVIASRYGLQSVMSKSIKYIDTSVLVNELWYFFPDGAALVEKDFINDFNINHLYKDVKYNIDYPYSYELTNILTKIYRLGNTSKLVDIKPLTAWEARQLFFEVWKWLRMDSYIFQKIQEQ